MQWNDQSRLIHNCIRIKEFDRTKVFRIIKKWINKFSKLNDKYIFVMLFYYLISISGNLLKKVF